MNSFEESIFRLIQDDNKENIPPRKIQKNKVLKDEVLVLKDDRLRILKSMR